MRYLKDIPYLRDILIGLGFPKTRNENTINRGTRRLFENNSQHRSILSQTKNFA